MPTRLYLNAVLKQFSPPASQDVELSGCTWNLLGLASLGMIGSSYSQDYITKTATQCKSRIQATIDLHRAPAHGLSLGAAVVWAVSVPFNNI